MNVIVIARQNDGLPLAASMEQFPYEGLEEGISKTSNDLRKLIKHLLRLISRNEENRFPQAMSLKSLLDGIVFQ